MKKPNQVQKCKNVLFLAKIFLTEFNHLFRFENQEVDDSQSDQLVANQSINNENDEEFEDASMVLGIAKALYPFKGMRSFRMELILI